MRRIGIVLLLLLTSTAATAAETLSAETRTVAAVVSNEARLYVRI